MVRILGKKPKINSKPGETLGEKTLFTRSVAVVKQGTISLFIWTFHCLQTAGIAFLQPCSGAPEQNFTQDSWDPDVKAAAFPYAKPFR